MDKNAIILIITLIVSAIGFFLIFLKSSSDHKKSELKQKELQNEIDTLRTQYDEIQNSKKDLESKLQNTKMELQKTDIASEIGRKELKPGEKNYVSKSKEFLEEKIIQLVKKYVPPIIKFSAESPAIPENIKSELDDLIDQSISLEDIAPESNLVFCREYYKIKLFYLIHQKRYSDVENTLRKCISQFSNDSFFLTVYAEYTYSTGDYIETEKILTTLLDRNPGDINIYKRLIYCLIENDKLKKSLETAQDLYELDHTDEDAILLKGYALLANGMISQANKEFSKVLRVNPTSRRGNYYQGLLYKSINKFDKAIESFEKAHSYGNNDSDFILNLTKLYMNRSANHKIIDLLSDLLVKDEAKNPQLYTILAEVYINRNDRTEAEKVFLHVKDLTTRKSGDPRVWQSFSEIAFMTGFHVDAQKGYKEMLNVDQNNGWAHLGLAKTYFEIGKESEANNSITGAMDCSKNDIDLQIEIGLLHSKMKKFDKAVGIFSNISTKYPTHAKNYYALGKAYMDQHNHNEALKAFSFAIENGLQNESIYMNMAYIYTDLENYSEAIHKYQTVLQLNSKNSEAYNNLGVIYAMNNNFKMSLSSFKKALELNHEASDVHYNLSLAYNKIKDEKAAQEFESLRDSLPAI